MTTEKIKGIAQEVAHILYNEDESYNHMLWWSIDPKERKAEELELIIKVLLRDYCIVEKGNVGQMINDINVISFPIQFGPVKQKILVIATEMIKSDMKMVFGADIFNESDEKQCFEAAQSPNT